MRLGAFAVILLQSYSVNGNEVASELRALIKRLQALLPEDGGCFDWGEYRAASWQRHQLGQGQLLPYGRINQITLDDLLCINQQCQALDMNTRQFLADLPANNALLSGARGSGKSSLVHALLNKYQNQKLRLVEVNQINLIHLPEIIATLPSQHYKFILFCDDLSFEADDAGYKLLKSALEGSIFGGGCNVLVYATSNRRHLLPEYHSDNDAITVTKREIHYGEAVDEKVSLSDRFGLWLRFHPFNQDDYLAIAQRWVNTLSAKHGVIEIDANIVRREALIWAMERGNRSGRCAQHFARHLIGSAGLNGNCSK